MGSDLITMRRFDYRLLLRPPLRTYKYWWTVGTTQLDDRALRWNAVGGSEKVSVAVAA
jgi:hypothetical protein